MRRNTAVLLAICFMACMAALSGCQSTGTLANLGAAGVTPRARSSYTPAGNTLADELQWLAIQTACVGVYNMAETGDFTVDDPEDFYRPGDIREYLAELSGDRTSVDMFYGICFNYAQAAYNDIARYKNHYAGAGVKDWYIAAVFENPGQIVLFDPAPREQSTMIVNGVPVKENSRRNVRSHGSATYHAWLWVIANDGTIYWIDPTWTDTGGYVVWGLVRDGKEMELAPAARLCAVDLPNDAAMDPFNRGKAYMNANNWDLAIKEFTEVIRQDKNNALAYDERGYAYANKGDMTKALADFNQAIRLDPASAEVYRHRGWFYSVIKEDYDRAIADYSMAIRLDTGNAVYYLFRGTAYEFLKEDYDKAIADYTETIRLDPYNAIGRGNVYWDLARVYNTIGDPGKANAVYDQAVAAFTEAIGRDSENPWHYYYRGDVYGYKKDYDRAIADYTAAIGLAPGDAFRYSRRGRAYMGKKDYDRAIADYTTAIRLEPDSAYYYGWRGQAYEDKKDNTRAIADYEMALAIDPENYSGKNGLGRLKPAPPATADDYYIRGIRQDDPDKAIADYTAAIRLDPKNADYYAARGNKYVSKKDWNKAEADFKAALKIDPNNEEAEGGLSFVEIVLENPELFN
jgi:tetratricopeptide (TPR) repeat protein